MGSRKVGFVGVVLLMVLVGTSGASYDKQQRWRKAMMSGEGSSSVLLNRVGSSIVFPLHGNVYPNGYYNITLNIGQPAKPYFLDVDTGSDLTWLQCGAPGAHCTETPHPLYRPSNNLVPCTDPICASLHKPGEHRCESPDPCVYEVEYADGGSSLGVLVKDVFLLNFTSGLGLSPLIAFGCGYGASSHPLDGVLGLGRGKLSIISQLSSQNEVKNVVGHCLSGRGGGFLFFGDDIYDPSRITWISMSHGHPENYSPGFAEFVYDRKTTGQNRLHVVFDSGSSYTYLNSEAYQALITLVKKDVGYLKKADDDGALPLCWKGEKPFSSIHEVKEYFKPLAFIFSSDEKTRTMFELPREAYLIISSKGNVCLGILNGTQAGLGERNVIGDISMQDKMVIYDNEKQAIGWSPANCDQLPKSNSSFI